MQSFYSKLFFGTMVLILLVGTFGYAGDEKKSDMSKSGFFADFQMQMNEVEKKLTDLAEAIPAEKYSWRPAEGVRSVKEVVAHVGGANYYLPSLIGIKPPESISMDMEKTITDKSDAINAMKVSFEHVRKSLAGMTDADLDKPAELFGNKSDVRSALFILLSHTHEHLGQLIAYARSNGVVPPWTAAQQQSKEEEEDE
jgi:uncharacterized damage-inducible protein DinB